MTDYWPLLAAATVIVAVFGLYVGAWYAFFAGIRLLRKLPSWTIVGWLAKHYRYRNAMTIFRLSWVVPLYQRRYPRVLLLMTDNGPTSVAVQWTRNFRTNRTHGTRSLNTPGGGSLRWGRDEKELPGDVAKLPPCKWHKTGQYINEPSDEYGDFPVWEGTPYDGWVPMRHRRPGTERGWTYWWEGADTATFRSRPDMLKAVGWEPVVAMGKHQKHLQAVPDYEPFEEATQ